jgi:hypothetical protein
MNEEIKTTFNKNHVVCIIQRWWKKYTTIGILQKVYKTLKGQLTKNDLQKLTNMCKAITNKCKGDGAGLTSGSIIDMLLCDYLKSKLGEKYTDYHNGECDLMISDIPLSLKKINGKSTIALNWSKNENNNEEEHFTCDIIIINLRQEKWWKNCPNIKNIKPKMIYNDEIPSGIFIIDKQFCKYFIKLSSNNKTNTLIDAQNLYIMLKRSISMNLFISLPLPNETMEFNILKSFL